MLDKLKFKVSQNISDSDINAYNRIKIIYENKCLYGLEGGGNFSIYLDNSYLSLDFDIESGRVGNLGGDLDLSKIKRAVLAQPENVICGILCVDKIGNLVAGCGKRIEFKFDCLYDEKKHLLQLGVLNQNQAFYKFLDNAYAQLSSEGYLQGIMISDV